jgi:hypothetical protein
VVSIVIIAIGEVMLEMLDRLEGKVQYTENDEALQQQFNSLRSPYGPYPTNSRIGRCFLQKYCNLGLGQNGYLPGARVL